MAGLIATLKSAKKDKNLFPELLNVLPTILAHPIASIKNYEKASEITKKESPLQTAIGTGVNVLTALAPLSGSIRKGVGSAIAKVVTKKPIASATAGLITLGVATTSPTAVKKSIDVVSGLPENLVATGELVGGVIEGSKKLSDISGQDVKNVLIGAGVGGAGALLVKETYDYFKDKPKNSEDKTMNTFTPSPTSQNLPSGSVSEGSVATNNSYPLPRETQNMTSSKRRKKPTKRVPTNQISIKIDNRDNYVTSKRFK